MEPTEFEIQEMVDDFTRPARFPWHNAKNVTRDPAPVAVDFNVQDYATFVAHPSPFWKFPEEFLCLVGLSRHYTLNEETYPLFLDKDGEERKKDEPRLLETTVGRTVPLLPVALIVARENWTPVLINYLMRAVVVPRWNKEILPAGKGHTDSVTRLNLQTVNAPQGFVISLDSSHHSGTNIAEAKVDSFARPSVPVIIATTTITATADPVVAVKEKIVETSLFAAESTFAGGTDPAMAGLTDLTGSDFLVGGIRTVINPDSDLQKTYVPSGTLLKEAEVAKAIRLHVETSKLETAEKSLQDEVNGLNERNTILEKERNALDVKVTDLEAIVVSKERELTDSTAQLTSIKSQNDNVADQEKDQLLKAKDEETENLKAQGEVLPHLLTTIVGRKWLLTYGMELAVAKCLNSSEYLSALGTTISKAVEKGMQDGLVAMITHGKEGRVLTDFAAHNPSAEADYVSALQQLQGVNFPLLTKLKANKDASMEGTTDTVPATVDTTVAFSVTFASASIFDPISIDEYEVTGTDDQPTATENVADDNASLFSIVDDAELNIP
nr:hypothetical protein [Tanacetum cinerariifolium]